ncbi:3-methyladenine DNA glycosylase AlkD [Dysgonomonadaceae bacterium PH5-43]|nr:3-methyladenine DNA glycosylase AlkD [Dysgonomonadaceae bacterium PH5-43]
MNAKLQEIRKKLYLQRDGASSASMREKGLDYKINFGVPTPTLRKIAQNYYPDCALANELWNKNNRELKILATMIQDPSMFSDTNKWIEEINNPELAEQAVMNLFCKLSNAEELANEWIQSDKQYIKISGFLLYSRLFTLDIPIKGNIEEFVSIATENLNAESLLVKNAANNALLKLSDKQQADIQ